MCSCSTGDDGDLTTEPHEFTSESWNSGMLEHCNSWVIISLFHHSTIPIIPMFHFFHLSLSRCSLKSSGFHHGLIPSDSAMTRAAL